MNKDRKVQLLKMNKSRFEIKDHVEFEKREKAIHNRMLITKYFSFFLIMIASSFIVICGMRGDAVGNSLGILGCFWITIVSMFTSQMRSEKQRLTSLKEFARLESLITNSDEVE